MGVGAAATCFSATGGMAEGPQRPVSKVFAGNPPWVGVVRVPPCVVLVMNETWKFVQAKSKQAMKQLLGIKDEAARMKVTPPLAVAPLAHGDDMRWNPNDDGIIFNP